jgi:hypothetical protein
MNSPLRLTVPNVCIVIALAGCSGEAEVAELEQASAASTETSAAALTSLPPAEGPQAISWGSTNGTALKYDILVKETQKAAIAKFAGKRDLALTLTLQTASSRQDVLPLLARLERYAVHQKDEDGFEFRLDSAKPAAEAPDPNDHATIIELTRRGFPVAMGSTGNLLQFPGWSTDSTHNQTLASETGDDVARALEQLLVPVDGGDATVHGKWAVDIVWDELRDDIPIHIEHELVSVSEELDRRLATIKFHGSGQQVQEGSPPYTAKVEVEGQYDFSISHRCLVSAESVEKLTTDDAFDTSRTRQFTIRLTGASQGDPASVERELAGDVLQLRPWRERSIVRR